MIDCNGLNNSDKQRIMQVGFKRWLEEAAKAQEKRLRDRKRARKEKKLCH